MDRPKHKVNAKKFLQDFRAGKSQEELMQGHGLSRVTLEKLYHALIERKLLDPSELGPQRIDSQTEIPRITQPVEPESDVPRAYRQAAPPDFSRCPQCGAEVGKRDLTCPECGHMLPGEERWERVEPKTRLVDRIPPKVLGCIVAFPIAVGFFFLFRDIILPMSESAISRRANALRQETQGAAPMKLAKDMANVGSANIIKVEVERLVGEEILSRANEDFSTFVAGPKWQELSHEGKLEQLSGIRQSLRKSAMRPDFKLNSETGQPLARVRGVHIEIFGDVPQDQAPPETVFQQQPAAEPQSDPGAIERAVEKRLPAGLDRKFPNRGF
ncbi:MAG TPA: zinc ribbon domain-containing protein [Desulfomonilaceae bacterium]|nr:zinc ribbon domain-containing protein [Desulfomonilaceae bacterium]